MKKIFLFLIFLFLFTQCNNQPNNNNQWIFLFDGETTSGWRGYNSETMPPGWIVKEGFLTFETELRLETDWIGGRDIIFGNEEFENFELYLEWKLPVGGNSGIFYHIKEGYPSISDVSPEYQLIDDLKWGEINNATLEEWQKTGADYAMYTPDNSKKIVKPAGEWNTSKIIFTSEKVEYWLNEKILLSFVPWSEDWELRKASGKWKDSPNYGKFKKGFIGLQDHDASIWFKNIKIRKL
ncbi:MAG: hypothetical protein ACI9TK_001399 [Flavobacteriaceae bacterium]|jgi:hypothetical protein